MREGINGFGGQKFSKIHLLFFVLQLILKKYSVKNYSVNTFSV